MLLALRWWLRIYRLLRPPLVEIARRRLNHWRLHRSA
jgi:hypothetical protein